MTLKTRQLDTIAAELQTRYHLAHVADTPREQVIVAELQGIAVQARCALAGATWQRWTRCGRGCRRCGRSRRRWANDNTP